MRQGDSQSPLTGRLGEVLLGDQGEQLCRYLRSVFNSVTLHGVCQGDQLACAADEAPSLAEELSLTRCRGRQIRLSSLGYKLGNVAKEYCNWIDEGRPLPQGVSACDVAGKRVLDVGCGFGRHLFAYARHGASGVVGVEPQDLFRAVGSVLALREKVPAQCLVAGQADRLPVPDGSFDMLVCRHVLTYVPRVRRALAEFARVLRPGGLAVIVYPTFDRLRGFIGRAARSCNLRSLLWYGFAAINSVCLEWTGRQIRLFKPGRMHSVHSPNYPPARWVRAALQDVGFRVVASAGDGNDDGMFRAEKTP